jgi:hypothetical protein
MDIKEDEIHQHRQVHAGHYLHRLLAAEPFQYREQAGTAGQIHEHYGGAPIHRGKDPLLQGVPVAAGVRYRDQRARQAADLFCGMHQCLRQGAVTHHHALQLFTHSPLADIPAGRVAPSFA